MPNAACLGVEARIMETTTASIYLPYKLSYPDYRDMRRKQSAKSKRVYTDTRTRCGEAPFFRIAHAQYGLVHVTRSRRRRTNGRRLYINH